MAERLAADGRPSSRVATGWLIAALVASLVPILYLVSVSFMSQGEVAAGRLIPTRPTLGAWTRAFSGPVPIAIVNSLVVSVISTVVSLALALPAAWAIVRFRTGGRLLAGTFLAPWLLPPIVAIVPLFMLLRILGLNNTLTGLTLLYAIMNVGLAVWLLEGFVRRLPIELEEAARLDGAGEFGVLTRIIVPLTGPALVAVGAILVILSYNEYLFAAFVTQSEQSRTVPVVISLMLSERIQDFGRVAAASLLGAVPPLAVAAILQKRLVEGLTSGALK
ncbi:ABC transporter permease [Microbacterium sorbitolivorans]|uniref:Carbohydrate ABC transporter permease n=1 Tax=Microbacterium sorbitolivorans TaxID=1867410 RepID=A0A367Y7B2_9MICO|nr:carbohydrate ABC transporter permease [Microbacterium sorbitolivorans]RCK61756.1 carbohydrate ABC transporter permease [Microbacterium sorbitolivorans]GGF29399.1 ABC transporter permease [Microbacterium sorbitolivorans]